jgi:citrate synthase
MARVPARGLADVVAASTALSEFSASRMAGWTAHVIEQHADNRLIRPDSEYIGERGMRWVPGGAR